MNFLLPRTEVPEDGLIFTFAVFFSQPTDHFTASISLFQVDEMYREAPIKNGMFDYIEFTRILKHGAKEKDEEWKIALILR